MRKWRDSWLLLMVAGVGCYLWVLWSMQTKIVCDSPCGCCPGSEDKGEVQFAIRSYLWQTIEHRIASLGQCGMMGCGLTSYKRVLYPDMLILGGLLIIFGIKIKK